MNRKKLTQTDFYFVTDGQTKILTRPFEMPGKTSNFVDLFETSRVLCAVKVVYNEGRRGVRGHLQEVIQQAMTYYVA